MTLLSSFWRWLMAIATRLKTDTSVIVDDFPQASVLFADVVGFTPMPATMTPPQLVGC